MDTTVRVLHLDDNPQDAELVALALDVQKTEFPVSIHYVQNREEFLAALEQKDFDIILSDYRMPDFDGEQALKIVRERCPEIPFIMVTGELGEERVIETLKRGATDYVLKDRIFRLVPAMQRALTEAEIERKRREAEAALRVSEERFSAAFRASPDPFVISRLDDGVILGVNEAFLKLFQMTREQVMGNSSLSLGLFARPADRDGAIFRLRRDGALRNFPSRIRTVSGEERLVMLSAERLELNGEAALVTVMHDVTEQKRAEAALRESEQRLRATFKNAALGLVEADLEGHLLEVNDRVCSILGYPRDELLRLTVHELTAPEDREESDRLNARLITGAVESFDYEKRYVRRDGSRLWVHMTVSAVRDDAGKFLRAIGTVEDISVRKETEAALLESENRYRSMFENSHAVMLILDPDTGQIVDANPAAEEYYGWNRRELTSMSIHQISTHPSEEVVAQMNEAKYAHRKHFVFHHRRAGGDVRDVEVHTGPVEVHGRRLLHSIIHDVSERRLAEERLEWHLENSPLAVVEWDKAYRITRWSREAARLFGYSKEELIGRRIEDLHLVVPEDIAIVEKTMSRLSGGQEDTVVSENRNVTRDGRIIHCVWHNSVLTDADGKMNSVMSLVQDVTAERSANASLQKTIASLQVLVTSSNEHMILMDGEGTVLCSSRRAAATLGYGSKEIEGKSWRTFVPEEQMIHARFFYRDLQRDLAGRIVAALALVTATGEKALFSLNASRVSLGESFGYLLRVERVSTGGTPEITRTEGIPARSPSGRVRHPR